MATIQPMPAPAAQLANPSTSSKSCSMCGRSFEKLFLLAQHFKKEHGSSTATQKPQVIGTQATATPFPVTSSTTTATDPPSPEYDGDVVKNPEIPTQDNGETSVSDDSKVAEVFDKDQYSQIEMPGDNLKTQATPSQQNSNSGQLIPLDAVSRALLVSADPKLVAVKEQVQSNLAASVTAPDVPQLQQGQDGQANVDLKNFATHMLLATTTTMTNNNYIDLDLSGRPILLRKTSRRRIQTKFFDEIHDANDPEERTTSTRKSGQLRKPRVAFNPGKAKQTRKSTEKVGTFDKKTLDENSSNQQNEHQQVEQQESGLGQSIVDQHEESAINDEARSAPTESSQTSPTSSKTVTPPTGLVITLLTETATSASSTVTQPAATKRRPARKQPMKLCKNQDDLSSSPDLTSVPVTSSAAQTKPRASRPQNQSPNTSSKSAQEPSALEHPIKAVEPLSTRPTPDQSFENSISAAVVKTPTSATSSDQPGLILKPSPADAAPNTPILAPVKKQRRSRQPTLVPFSDESFAATSTPIVAPSAGGKRRQSTRGGEKTENQDPGFEPPAKKRQYSRKSALPVAITENEQDRTGDNSHCLDISSIRDMAASPITPKLVSQVSGAQDVSSMTPATKPTKGTNKTIEAALKVGKKSAPKTAATAKPASTPETEAPPKRPRGRPRKDDVTMRTKNNPTRKSGRDIEKRQDQTEHKVGKKVVMLQPMFRIFGKLVKQRQRKRTTKVNESNSVKTKPTLPGVSPTSRSARTRTPSTQATQTGPMPTPMPTPVSVKLEFDHEEPEIVEELVVNVQPEVIFVAEDDEDNEDDEDAEEGEMIEWQNENSRSSFGSHEGDDDVVHLDGSYDSDDLLSLTDSDDEVEDDLESTNGSSDVEFLHEDTSKFSLASVRTKKQPTLTIVPAGTSEGLFKDELESNHNKVIDRRFRNHCFEFFPLDSEVDHLVIRKEDLYFDDDEDIKFPTDGPYLCEICNVFVQTNFEFYHHVSDLHRNEVDEATLVRMKELLDCERELEIENGLITIE